MMRKIVLAVMMVILLGQIGWGAEAERVLEQHTGEVAWEIPVRSDLRIEINIPEYRLRIFAGQELVFEGPIGIGRTNHETPLGEYTVLNRIENPTWYPKGKDPVPPGPTNPLGEYWLGLSIKGYGIHGNINPASIGRLASSGCIRMRNEDIQYLYHLIQVGTPVSIRYQTLFLEEGQGSQVQSEWPMGRGQVRLDARVEPRLRVLKDVYELGSNNVFAFAKLMEGHELKKEVFIPYLSYLLDHTQEGWIELPWKVDLYYQGRVYANLAFRHQGQIYLDPRGIDEFIQREAKVTQLAQERQKRYLPVEDVMHELVNHRIVVRNDRKVVFLFEEAEELSGRAEWVRESDQ